jgi:hypothetical protein
MALSYLTDINLNKNQLQNSVIQKVSTDPTTGLTAGWIIYNTTDNELKFYDGSEWISTVGDITSVAVNPGEGLEVESGSSSATSGDFSVTLGLASSVSGNGLAYNSGVISVNVDDVTLAIATDTLKIKNGGVDTDQLASGAVTNAKMAANSVDSDQYVDGSVDNIHLANDSITIGDSTIALGGSDTTLTGLTDIDLTSGAKTIFDGVGANDLTIGASSTTVVIPGDLQVTGTTTTNNVETVSTSNGVIFEGNTADDNEVTLLAATVTADRTATLPDKTGTLAMLDDINGRSVVATIDVSDTNFISNKYAEITHNLSTEDVIVELFDSSTKETVYADVKRTDKANAASTSKVKILFSIVPTNDIEVIITSAASASSGTVAYS